MHQFKLDGLDIDWEYPTLGDADISHSPDDRHNFTVLLEELRARLDADAKTCAAEVVGTTSTASGRLGRLRATVRRAGVARVKNVGQLFYAAKALASKFRPLGNRLAIITNGGGPGVMAADRAGDLGIPLAQLTNETMAVLNKAMPTNWSHANPIDIGGDATPERYRDAIMAVTHDVNVDSTLVMLSPQAMTDPLAVAKAIIEVADKLNRSLICCWMGEDQVREARQLLEDSGIPAFRMPETAIELFHHISKYYRNQKLLLQTPEPTRQFGRPEAEGAKMLIEALLAERSFELCFEGQRWYDLVRFGKLEEGVKKLAKYSSVATSQAQNFQPKHVIFPIPQDVIDASNGKIEQNPLWK